MAKSLIAIVGRPNVGKSSIFNVLIGERISIVHDSPGVTRDRIYADGEWFGREFILIDTGGLEIGSDDPITIQMRRQVEFAIEACDAIIFLCDIRDGLTNADREIAGLLRQSAKPVVLALNKADRIGGFPPEAYEFYELGFGEPHCVSAIHKLGLGDLISDVFSKIPQREVAEADDDRIAVAIIGKPNVGKSSLMNVILAEERAIVSDIPGTTRDALDVFVENDYGSYTFIDTAGLRRKSRIDNVIEKYSTFRTDSAVERSDVCLILLDAEDGVSEQDTKIAGLAHEAGKASIFVINKWDLLDEKGERYKKWVEDIRTRFAFMPYAPIITISALTGQRVEGLFNLINKVYAEAERRLSTSVINEVLAEAVAMHKSPSKQGRHLKIYYASQVDIKPPQIVFFINDKKLLHFSYERYIENRFREAFGFEGTPIRMIWRERRQTDYIRVKEDQL